MFECAICLDIIKYSAVGSCMHHFCYFCLLEHCKSKNTCPLCNININEIKFDREFDSLIHKDSLPTFNYNNKIILYPDKLINDPGLTIKNNIKGPGIIITKIKFPGLFSKYLFKLNDIILFINDVPCYNHIYAMKQIMYLFQSNKPITIIKI